MCGRYVLVQKKEIIEKRFNVSVENAEEYRPSYNISPGKSSLVITDKNPDKAQLFRFGLIPFWAKKSMLFINARTEGDHNKSNDINYTGVKGIITKPAFRKPIRSQRCLIIADAFIEGSTNEKLSKPYLVYLRNKQRPFAFAGIWDTWQNPVNSEIIQSFAIITTVANSLLQSIPHHRSPVILEPKYERQWLNTKLPLAEVTRMLKIYPAELMNAYPISHGIKDPRAEGKSLISPIGQRLEKEFGTVVKDSWELRGMGSNKRFSFNPDTAWGETPKE